MLVVKLERLSELLSTVVSDFLGSPLQNVRANIGRQKDTGNIYAEVKRTLQLPQSVCEEIYGHDWVRHFYTEEEIETFERRWSDGKSSRHQIT